MIITKDDIGGQVTLRNGDIHTIDNYDEHPHFPVHAGTLCWTSTGNFLAGGRHPYDIVKLVGIKGGTQYIVTAPVSTDYVRPTTITGSWINNPDAEIVDDGPIICKHTWVGSGFSGGAVWCSRCDEDYEETLHGNSGL